MLKLIPTELRGFQFPDCTFVKLDCARINLPEVHRLSVLFSRVRIGKYAITYLLDGLPYASGELDFTNIDSKILEEAIDCWMTDGIAIISDCGRNPDCGIYAVAR